MSDYIIQKLGLEHKTDLLNLSDTIVEQIPDKISYMPFKEETLDKMKDDSVIYIGAFDNGKLIASSGLYFNEKPAVELPDMKGNFAKIGHCMVLPQYRGNNLMYKLNEKLVEIAKKNNVQYIAMTVHPDNVASYTSMEKLGASKSAEVMIRDIYPRYIYTIDLTKK